MTRRFGLTIIALTMLSVGIFSHPAGATTINLENPFIFRDVRDNTLINGGFQDFIQVDIDVVDNSNQFVPGVDVKATNTNTNEVFALQDCADVIFNCYFVNVPYTTARANGDWDIVAIGDMNTETTTIPAYGTGSGTDALPFALDVQVAGGFTPTATWVLPDLNVNDGNVDRWRIRVNRADDFTEVFDSRRDLGLSLPLNTTSYTVPEGFITEPGEYRMQVMLEGFDPFNRSRVRANFLVPEPGSVVLLGLGLAGLGLRARRLSSRGG